jgi:hypothetical protein
VSRQASTQSKKPMEGIKRKRKREEDTDQWEGGGVLPLPANSASIFLVGSGAPRKKEGGQSVATEASGRAHSLRAHTRLR